MNTKTAIISALIVVSALPIIAGVLSLFGRFELEAFLSDYKWFALVFVILVGGGIAINHFKTNKR